MTLSHRALGAIYLCAIIAFWTFQLGAGGAAAPVYLALTPILFVVPILNFALIRILLAGGAVMALMLVAAILGAHILRPTISLIALFMVLVAGLASVASIRLSIEDHWYLVAKGLKLIIRVQIALQFVQVAGFNPLENRSGAHYFLPIDRPSGLMIEPSYVALTLSPLILASLWPRSKSFGGHLTYLDFALVYFSLLLCPSATMINVFVIAIGLRVAAAQPITGILLILVSASTWQYLYLLIDSMPEALAERVRDLFLLMQTGYIDKQSNLSSVVFYGGYIAAKSTLEQYPLGVGFLNMAHVYGTDVLALYRQVVGDSNVNDGSSILFKMITEFGYIGLCFALYSCLSIWRYFSIERPDITVGLLAFPILACFFRGGSYLDGPVVVAIAIIIVGFRTIESSPPDAKEMARY